MKIFKTKNDKYLSAESIMTNDKKTAEDKLQKNIITAGGTASVTATTSGENQIPFTKVIEQIGNKFTISNNRVYVGPGVNKVLVNASVYFNLDANRGSALNLYIRKNGSNVNGQTNSGFAGGGNTRNLCLSLSPRLVSVSEGDYFELYTYVYNRRCY